MTSIVTATSDARAFLAAFSAAVDARNGADVGAFFAPDGTFVFANMPPVRGPHAIADANDQFFGAIAGIRHEIVDVWDVESHIVARLTVTYTRHDGKTVSLPSVNVVRRAADGSIKEFQVYMDIAPVFASEV